MILDITMELNLVITVSMLISFALGGELTFELSDNAHMCFYEELSDGVEATLEFQVSTINQFLSMHDYNSSNSSRSEVYAIDINAYFVFFSTGDPRWKLRLRFRNKRSFR
mgnify:CR=1 FL=1